ncbi:hypothetical protein ACWPM1_07105 [Tsuneonella sp. HG249]
MPRALKVFRTAAGFHDAYVAAPSRKAALEAWGADVDLFARGIAEQVTDPKLTAAPLKAPGEVIMLSRGGLADQLKALGPKTKKKRAAEEKPEKSAPKQSKPPSRAQLDKAEVALESAERRHAAELKKLEAQQAKLQAKIDELVSEHRTETVALKRRRRDAEDAYRDALDAWSG